jgi:hypothetical protein
VTVKAAIHNILYKQHILTLVIQTDLIKLIKMKGNIRWVIIRNSTNFYNDKLFNIICQYKSEYGTLAANSIISTEASNRFMLFANI